LIIRLPSDSYIPTTMTTKDVKRTSDQVNISDDDVSYSVKKAKTDAPITGEEKVEPPPSEIASPEEASVCSIKTASDATEFPTESKRSDVKEEKTKVDDGVKLVVRSMIDLLNFAVEKDVKTLTEIVFMPTVKVDSKAPSKIKKYAPKLRILTVCSPSMLKSLSALKTDELPQIRELNIVGGSIIDAMNLICQLRQNYQLSHLDLRELADGNFDRRRELCSFISGIKLTSLLVDNSAYQGESLFTGNLAESLEELFVDYGVHMLIWDIGNLSACGKLKKLYIQITINPISEKQMNTIQSLRKLEMLFIPKPCSKEQIAALAGMESLKELAYTKMTAQMAVDISDASGLPFIKRITSSSEAAVRVSKVAADLIPRYELSSGNGSTKTLILSSFQSE
jgi:hypothetical protein